MFGKKIVFAFAIMIAALSLVIGYTVSANYVGGNDNASRKKAGRGPVRAGAAKSKSKNTRGKDQDKNGKRRDKNADQEKKVIRIDPNADQTPQGPISKSAEAFGVTPELKSNPDIMNGVAPFAGEIKIEDEENNEAQVERTLPGAWAADRATIDPLAMLSRAASESLAPQAMPGPSLTFNGILSTEVAAANSGSTSMPPDTVGDVGPNHYVQATNIGVFRVFNKATGAPITAIAKISNLFSGLPVGNPCRTIDDGDPVVNYDPMADRWLVSQFQVSVAPNGQCIAVSQTGDPTGAWYAYYFAQPNSSFPDYPHWGVWTDGYYLATHEFPAVGSGYVGGGFFAFNREKMLAGDATANYIYFTRAASYGQMPADVDGYMPPAVGAPAMFFELNADEYGGTDSLLNYEFVPNFTTPASSTLIVKPVVAVAAFDPRSPTGRAHIEQPAPATAADNFDSIGGQLMYRVAYRNLGTIVSPVNSYVMNWTVNVTADNPTTAGTFQTAPRWTEMRRSGAGAMSVFDQGTHAPDPVSGTGRNRWMGSIAQDYLGNIALGFSRSGPSAGQFPDIVWAGRTGGQTAAGTMNEGEATMYASTGVQQATNSRWGDYSSMTVDPADDCTFWFTQEYRDTAFNGTASGNPFKWSTRIGKFKFPACSAQPKGQIAVNVTSCSSGAPINNARVTAVAGNFLRMTGASGNLISNIIAAPGSYVVTAGKGSLIPASTSATIINGNTTNVNICLTGTAVINADAPTITSESCAVNNAADPGEIVTVTLPLRNAEGNAISNLTATLQATGGVVAPGAAQNYGALAAGGAAAARSFTFAVDPNVLPGSTIALTLQLQDGVTNLGTVIYTLPVGAVVGAAQNFSYTGAVAAIPDGNATGVNTTVSVSGVSGAVQDLNFVITGTASTPSTSTGIDHTWIGDLVVKLTSPSGTTVTLINSIGSGDCASNNIFNTTLDDSAANAIAGACPGNTSAGPLTGTFKPENPLSAFNGENPNGTWTLNVSDTTAIDTGSVRAYRLVITPATAACAGKVISGRVGYGTDASKSVPGVTVTTGAPVVSATTNSAGAYTLSNLASGNYTVTPSKIGNANGITPFDATLVLRCVAAGAGCTLSSNQQLAADTNGSGNITPFDATLILRYVAANGPNANTGGTGTWKFNFASKTYNPFSGSLVNESYTAFLLGEVNGSWTASGSIPNLEEGDSSR
jgi:subtilisin-like proprotein convertase family protein